MDGENPYTDDELPEGLRRTFIAVDESEAGYFATLTPLDKDLQDWLKDGSATATGWTTWATGWTTWLKDWLMDDEAEAI